MARKTGTTTKQPTIAPRAARAASKQVPEALTESLDDLPPGASEQAYETFMPLARRIATPLVPYRGGALIALANVQAGVDALKGRDRGVAEHLARLDRAALWASAE